MSPPPISFTPLSRTEGQPDTHSQDKKQVPHIITSVTNQAQALVIANRLKEGLPAESDFGEFPRAHIAAFDVETCGGPVIRGHLLGADWDDDAHRWHVMVELEDLSGCDDPYLRSNAYDHLVEAAEETYAEFPAELAGNFTLKDGCQCVHCRYVRGDENGDDRIMNFDPDLTTYELDESFMAAHLPEIE